MRKQITGIVIIILVSLAGYAQTGERQDEQSPALSLFSKATTQWFSSWELVSREIYHLKNFEPVDFVFFTGDTLYSTSEISIPAGIRINGPLLMNLPLRWAKAGLGERITLPDKKKVPPGIMSFASPYHGVNAESYFVMPLPEVWQKAGVTSEELGFENLLTGVFLHEFSHSQQMENFGKRITTFENETDFGVEFSDDILQDLFKNDSAYVSLYRLETDYFEQAISERERKSKELLIRKGLETMRKRKSRFFKGSYSPLNEIEDLFLTMEGLGQFTMYSWFVHPKGGNMTREKAIRGTRRGKNWWSQDEGFLLFLVLEQLSGPENWAYRMFGTETVSVISLIEKNLTQDL